MEVELGGSVGRVAFKDKVVTDAEFIGFGEVIPVVCLGLNVVKAHMVTFGEVAEFVVHCTVFELLHAGIVSKRRKRTLSPQT